MQKARDILYDVLLCHLGSQPGAVVVDGMIGLPDPIDVMALADNLAETMGIFDLVYSPDQTFESISAQAIGADYELNGRRPN